MIPLGVAGLAGMVAAACLDGSWTRWRRRRWLSQWRATRDPLEPARTELRLILGEGAPQPGVRVMPPAPYDWADEVAR